MINTALFDVNVILDWLLEREPFREFAESVIEPVIYGRIKGYVASHSLTNIFYILRKEFSVEQRQEIILMICRRFEIISAVFSNAK